MPCTATDPHKCCAEQALESALASSASPRAIADWAVAKGCSSVAFTYNDPVIFAEYAIDVAAACRRAGLRIGEGVATASAVAPNFFWPLRLAFAILPAGAGLLVGQLRCCPGEMP